MKKIYLLLAFSALFLAGCSKRDLLSSQPTGNDWIRSHDKGVVAYVDNYTGNYIVDTYNGYAVIDVQGGVSPRVYDEEYAYFSNRGLQTTYNYTANYFTDVRVVESWLNWQDARYVLDQLSAPY